MLFVVMMASKMKNIIAFGYCQEKGGKRITSIAGFHLFRSCLLDNGQIQI